MKHLPPACLLLAAPLLAQGEALYSLNADPTEGNSGQSVALTNGLLFFGSPGASPTSGSEGSVLVYDVFTGGQVGVWTDPAPTFGDAFGFALAVQGDTAIVGNPGYDDSPNGLYRGRAVVIDVPTGQVLSTFEAPVQMNGDRLGEAVDLDGGLGIISSWRKDTSAGIDSGVTYVFDLTTGALHHELIPPQFSQQTGRFIALESGRVFVSNTGIVGGGIEVYDAASGNHITRLTGSDVGSGLFGWGMEVYGDTLVTSGSPTGDMNNSSLYLFDVNTLTEIGIIHPPSGASFWRYFAINDERILSMNSQGVDVVDRASNTIIATLEDPMGAGTFNFGTDMALDGAFALIGSPFANSAHLLAPGGSVGSSYCTAVPNSTGQPGLLESFGLVSASDNVLVLRASQLPAHKTTLLVNGPQQGFIQNPGGSNGNLCIAGSIGRHKSQIHSTGVAGTALISVDLTALPRAGGTHMVQAGETWNFQAWHRDGSSSNFTEGRSVTFN